MRKPKKRGSPVNSARIQSWLTEFDGYRVAITEERIQEWLNQFRKADVDLGSRVLDALVFVKSEGMENSLRIMINSLPGWNIDPARRTGKWRFLAFSMSAGESGDTIIPKCRTALGLTGRLHNKMFIYKSDLPLQNLGPDDTVVFMDDFAGTGTQATNAWHEILEELLPEGPKIYLLLIVAGQQAVEKIHRETRLEVVSDHILDSDDDIFSTKCRHFNRPEKDRVLFYCKRAGKKLPRGYGECGFLVVMAHKTPNNSIPILHSNHDRWRGLFPRLA